MCTAYDHHETINRTPADDGIRTLESSYFAEGRSWPGMLSVDLISSDNRLAGEVRRPKHRRDSGDATSCDVGDVEKWPLTP